MRLSRQFQAYLLREGFQRKNSSKMQNKQLSPSEKFLRA